MRYSAIISTTFTRIRVTGLPEDFDTDTPAALAGRHRIIEAARAVVHAGLDQLGAAAPGDPGRLASGIEATDEEIATAREGFSALAAQVADDPQASLHPLLRPLVSRHGVVLSRALQLGARQLDSPDTQQPADTEQPNAPVSAAGAVRVRMYGHRLASVLVETVMYEASDIMSE